MEKDKMDIASTILLLLILIGFSFIVYILYKIDFFPDYEPIVPIKVEHAFIEEKYVDFRSSKLLLPMINVEYSYIVNGKKYIQKDIERSFSCGISSSTGPLQTFSIFDDNHYDKRVQKLKSYVNVLKTQKNLGALVKKNNNDASCIFKDNNFIFYKEY